MQLSGIENKIIECLKNAQPKDLSINEIAKLIGINRLTVSKYIAVLFVRGVIILSRKVGKAKMYQLAPEYAKIASTVFEKEKPKVTVQFLKNFLQYKAGQMASLNGDEARELIKSGFAREITT